MKEMSNVDYIRFLTAWDMGKYAARMRAAGHTPEELNPLKAPDFGAFQWADALGITAPRERSGFSTAFTETLNEAQS